MTDLLYKNKVRILWIKKRKAASRCWENTSNDWKYNTRSEKAIKDKWQVLCSSPADFTPVCTTESAAFAKRNNVFKRLNAELFGLSINSVFLISNEPSE